MALRTPPSWLQNGSHSAENDRLTNQAIWKSTGIVNPSDLQITQNGTPNMTVNIGSGWAAIVGTYQSNMGVYMAYNDATVNATITTANASNPRIDLVCLTVSDAYYTGSTNTVAVNIVAGTPASSPTVPATPTNSIALGQVYVGAGVTSILTANITNYGVRATSPVVSNVVTAKGDLIAATGSGAVTNLPVGTDGSTLVANSSASTGVSWTTPVGTLANPVINGGQDLWQRGTSFAISNTYAYTADRWQGRTTAACTTSYSRVATGDTTNLPNIQYAMRVQRTSGQTANPYMIYEQSFESVNSIPFAGKTITLSFYARAGSNFSAASNNLTMQMYSGTGTDENIRSGYTGQVTLINQNATLTTTWQRFAYTATVASTATELAISMLYLTTGTAGTNDYFDITGVQIDVGSYTATTAPAFRRSGGTLQGELSACMRYYYRIYSEVVAGTLIGSGQANSTTTAGMIAPHPVPMRAIPSYSISGGALTQANGNRTTTLTSSSNNGMTSKYMSILATIGSALLTAGYATQLIGYLSSTTDYLEASAEL